MEYSSSIIKSSLYLYLALGLLLLLLHVVPSNCCFHEERSGLLQIKSHFNSMINASSTQKHDLFPSWVDDTDHHDCCLWEKVICDHSTGHVIRLYLNYTATFAQPWPLNLTVFLPLQHLVSLSLPWNSIGSLLSGFQVLPSLKKLQVLDLSNNNIVGTVTSHGLCESRSLQQMYLYTNSFSGNLPECLANMPSLRVIDVSHNHLTGSITSLLSNLTSLVNLNVDDNRFEPISIRGAFSKTPYLDHLGLSNNALLQDDGDIHWSPPFQLSYLQLNYCNLSKFPVKFLFNQRNLYHVEMSGNGFVGSFPTWLLQNNSRLQDLYLDMNSLTGSLEFPNHQNLSLAYLYLSGNMLTGTLQENLGMILPNLQWLDASQNQLQGQIPSSITNLTVLGYLDLSSNYFSGEVPKGLFTDCISLNYLKLSDNHLRGEVIPKIVNLTLLYWMFLDDNHFDKMPEDSFFPNNQLAYFDISNNNLFGKVPRWIDGFTELQILSMAGNKFRGSIPDEVCKLTSLTFLDLSTNDLEGGIPSCFSNLPGLSFLHLHNNRISGHVPYTLWNDSNLVILDLSYNRFSGGIPLWIDQLQNLRVLLLGGNSLRGELPSRLCHLQHLNILDLSSNGISGRIPACFKNMSFGINGTYNGYYQEQLGFKTKDRNYFYVGSAFLNMSGLDLSCNQLTGPIPSELGDLKGMHSLNLSHNHLFGPIPSSFSKLESIESLDLSCNNLSGAIPSQLGALYFLEIFNLSYNNLSGKPPMSGQFATFDVNNYKGNPLLCGYPQGRSCNNGSSVTPNSNEDNEAGDEEFNWEVLLLSFGMSCAIFFVGSNAVLYINPQWHRALYVFFNLHILWWLHPSYLIRVYC